MELFGARQVLLNPLEMEESNKSDVAFSAITLHVHGKKINKQFLSSLFCSLNVKGIESIKIGLLPSTNFDVDCP